MLVKPICLCVATTLTAWLLNIGISNSRCIDNYVDYTSGWLCDVINLSIPFLQNYWHQFVSFSPFYKQFKDKSKVI